MPAVVVDPQHRQRPRDDLQVAVPDVLEVGHRGEITVHLVGVAAQQDRVEPVRVAQSVDAPGGLLVLGPLGRRRDRVQVERDADLRLRTGGTDGVHREAVPQQQVVCGPDGGGCVTPSGRMITGRVPHEGGAPRLVQGGPVLDPVAECTVHNGGVLGKTVGRVAQWPAARVLDRLRKVPVVEGQPRRDAVVEQLVDEAPVEVQSGRVGRAGAGRLHPRPGNRETVRVEAQPLHHRHVIAVTVVVVGCHMPGVSTDDPAGRCAESVPNGGCTAVGSRPLPRSDTRRWPRPTGSPPGIAAGRSGWRRPRRCR